MGSYNYYKMFGCFNRKFKITEAGPTPDVVDAFLRYSKKESHLSADQMLQFLIEFQGEEDRTLSDAEKIIQHVLHQRHESTVFTSNTLTLEDLFYFLFNDDLNGPIKTEVHHDMTAPLQHYFIYTGHNSYLTGNQISSDCSAVPIIKALERGVRAIELDIWPNSSKDGINVLHGRTLTAPVPLIKCLESIKEHAFVKSPYPVIITLEDHLTPSLQAKVAEMIVEIFGDAVYYPEAECLDEFPSPESLKHRFIFSTKPPKEYLESKNSKDKETSPMAKDSSEEELTEKDISTSALTEQDAVDKSESDPEDEDGDANQRKSCQPCVNEYKRLIAIHAGKPKKGLRRALTAGLDKVRRLSVSEHELEKAATSYGPDVVRFTQNNLLRVYPKGTRISSSNYKPVTGWMHGAQMVAFNMQGYGKFLWLMHGMFRANGGCGYLKKPDFLIKKGESDEIFDPRVPLPVKTTLKVKVYMGDGWRLDFSQTHFDAYSPPDFYTKVHIFGAPADFAKKKTRVKEDDWAPIWDEEFTFPLTVPEIALLRIVVREYDRSEKDDFGGQTCLPISELKTGIRAVPLYDKKGKKFKSVKLLMQFQFI